MIEFKGFPARMQFTPVPNPVFSSLIPQITDITELKVLLYLLAVLYPKKGYLRFVSRAELLSQPGLVQNLRESPEDVVQKALADLTRRNVLIEVAVNRGGSAEAVYFLNTEANRQIADKVRSQELKLPGLLPERSLPVSPVEPSDIFTLYEQNIGLLTPLIADEIKEAGKQYPEDWIRDAIKEAVSLNKRSWRYISRILENWSAEGKDNGASRGYLKKDTDPDKYIRGKYGHMVRR